MFSRVYMIRSSSLEIESKTRFDGDINFYTESYLINSSKNNIFT